MKSFLDILSLVILVGIFEYTFAGVNTAQYTDLNDTVSFKLDVKPIFEKACAVCHKEKGLPDVTDYRIAYGLRHEIFNRVTKEKTMPKHGSMLTASERDIVGLWIETGAKQ